ncbi:MAG: FtsX-like permease family protein, partial [Candidatus Limnocylindrales bacterium]
MLIRTGLPGAVVQRSLADWPVVLAAWLLLVCATTLLATGVVYGDAVASGGLQRALLAAPPATRALDIALTTDPVALGTLDAAIRPELARAMAATGGDIVRIARSGSYADASTPPGSVTDLTIFESVDGVEQRATLSAGAWPTAGRDPIEVTVSDGAAAQMGIGVGDTLALVGRLDPTHKVDVTVTGIRVVDPADAIWLGEELETTGTTSGGTFTTRGPLGIREADLVTLGGSKARFQVSWRGVPTIANLRVDGVEPLGAGADGLATRLRGLVPASTSPRVTTSLPALLDEVGRSVLVSRSGVILLTIQFAVLAGYAVVLVAGMLVERRRSEIALLRSRGASGFHLIAMAVIESAVLAVPAAVLAPFLALGVVAILGIVGPTAGLGLTDSAAIGQNAIVVSAVAGIACMAALTLPTLFVSASPAGARAATGRQARTTIAQRLGLDLALVAVAAVALWQLRLYGAPLTRNVRGTLGLDPLLVAAPAIGLIGGAVLALRVVPRIAEVAEQVLARGNGLVASLGGRQLARRPLRYTRAALLLMLAAALGTLAAAHAATWTRSQTDQASYQAVADVRAVASTYSTLPTWGAGPRYRAIAGVVAAAPLSDAPFSVGRTVREGTLAGVDPAGVALLARSAGGGSPAAAQGAALAPLVGAAEAP